MIGGDPQREKHLFKHLKAPAKKLEVSSAYLSNKDCNYSDYDGFQMEEGGIRYIFLRMCHGHYS